MQRLAGAGHSSEVAQRLGSDGVLIGIDQDEMALAAAGARLRNLALNTPPQIELLRGNFGNLDELLLEAEIPGVDAFLFDLGVSSPQLVSRRGVLLQGRFPVGHEVGSGQTTVTAQSS